MVSAAPGEPVKPDRNNINSSYFKTRADEKAKEFEMLPEPVITITHFEKIFLPRAMASSSAITYQLMRIKIGNFDRDPRVHKCSTLGSMIDEKLLNLARNRTDIHNKRQYRHKSRKERKCKSKSTLTKRNYGYL